MLNKNSIHTTNRNLPFIQKLMVVFVHKYSIFSLMTLFFAVFFSSQTSSIDVNEYVYLSGEVEKGRGIVLDIFETDVTINEDLIYGYKYNFKMPNGEDIVWVSYGELTDINIGDEVNIDYNKNKPNINRISGKTNSKGGSIGLIFFIVFLIGLAFTIFSIIKGYKKLKIIENGEMAYAKLINETKTLVKINDKSVYKLEFQYEDKKGKEHRFTIKTNSPYDLTNEENEILFYNPEDNKKVVMLDDLSWPLPKYIRKNWL